MSPCFVATTLVVCFSTKKGIMNSEAIDAIHFGGPIMLGILIWEIVVTDICPAISTSFCFLCKRTFSNRAPKGRFRTQNRITSILLFLSRCSALAVLAVYLDYTQSNTCQTSPHVLAALGATVCYINLGNKVTMFLPNSPPFFFRHSPYQWLLCFFGELRLWTQKDK